MASMRYGSDKIAELIADLDVPFIAGNPGASFRGLHDSLVNPPSGKAMPELILCTHEEISVAIAHGYAKAAGKPMAAAIHNIVGLQHAAMAIFNAWCDRAPVLLLGGTGPMAADQRRPWIEWIHTALVQGNLVRDFVKFDDQPSSIAGFSDSIYRAYKLAVTEPAGPVYVCFDAELQERPIDEAEDEIFPGTGKEHFAPGTPPAADGAAIRTIAEAIAGAEWPVIVADFTGRSAEAFYALGELADKWGIAVLDKKGRLNIATTHPMNLTGVNDEVLKDADVVLLLDDRDAAGSFCRFDRERRKVVSALEPGARVFSIGLQDYGVRSWSADYQMLYPVEKTVLADTKLALPQLIEALARTGADEEKTERRKRQIAERHRELRREWLETAGKFGGVSPVPLSTLALKLRNALQGKPFVLANGELRGWTHKILEMDEPRQFLGGNGGGGLGYGIGAAIGCALAHRDDGKIVVNIQSDGDLLFTATGLWTLAHHNLPVLTIMDNNRTYYNSEEHQMLIARERGRDTSKAGIGTKIEDPNIDYAAMARSMGVWAIGPIDDPNEVDAAIAKALEVVEKEKKPALVDIVTNKVGYENSK